MGRSALPLKLRCNILQRPSSPQSPGRVGSAPYKVLGVQRLSQVQGRSEGGTKGGQPEPVLLPDSETRPLGSHRLGKNRSEEAASAAAAFSVVSHILATALAPRPPAPPRSREKRLCPRGKERRGRRGAEPGVRGGKSGAEGVAGPEPDLSRT